MRKIDADDFGNRMYHEAFEKDTDLRKWDSGCWIRYKLFENVLREQPTVQPELDSEALIRTIEMGVTATNSNDIYSLGMRNGMRWCKSLIDGVEPKFEDYVTSVDDWKKLPSAQPEERTEKRTESHACGLISRQAAIDALHTWFRDGFDEDKWWNSTHVLAAIEGLPSVQQERKWETCFECPLSHGCPKIKGCTNEQAIEYASQIPSDCPLPAQPEQKWIPCSERLPEEEIDVLVTRKFLGCKDSGHGWNNHMPPKTYVEVAQYSCGEWEALSDEYKIARNRHTNPIAWMPLPEPYKEGGVERRTDDK